MENAATAPFFEKERKRRIDIIQDALNKITKVQEEPAKKSHTDNQHNGEILNDNTHINEHCPVRVKYKEGEGICIVSNPKSPLSKGENILECPSASIALEPPHRQSYCGYCGAGTKIDDNTTPCKDYTHYSCKDCYLIVICSTCIEMGLTAEWHRQSGECMFLQALLHGRVLCEEESPSSLSSRTILEEKYKKQVANQIESIYIITTRLMHRRSYDQFRRKNHRKRKRLDTTGAKKASSTSGTTQNGDVHNGDNQQESRQHKQQCEKKTKNKNCEPQSNSIEANNDTDGNRNDYAIDCPLPPIDWDLFDQLYSHSTNPVEEASATSRIVSNTNDVVMENGESTNNIKENTTSSPFISFMMHLCNCINKSLQIILSQQKPLQQQQVNTDDYLSSLSSLPWSAKEGGGIPLFFEPADFMEIYSKCKGCCHAIIDLSRPLGMQTIGVGLFLHHSFYNHSCAPNLYISYENVFGSRRADANHNLPENEKNKQDTTGITSLTRQGKTTTSLSLATSCQHQDDNDDININAHDGNVNHVCAVVARVHCLQDIHDDNTPLTLSYIPMSGLDYQERNNKLADGYNFCCQCHICSAVQEQQKQPQQQIETNDGETHQNFQINCDGNDGRPSCTTEPISLSLLELEQKLVGLPAEADIEPIREIQYDTNHKIVNIMLFYDNKGNKSCNINDSGGNSQNPDICAVDNAPAQSKNMNSNHTNNALVDDDAHENSSMILDQCITTIQMIQRGIKNQKIPSSHEVSIESYRLLGMASLLQLIVQKQQQQERKLMCRKDKNDLCDNNDATATLIENTLKNFDDFFQAVEPIDKFGIFDPCTLAIQHYTIAKYCLQYCNYSINKDFSSDRINQNRSINIDDTTNNSKNDYDCKRNSSKKKSNHSDDNDGDSNGQTLNGEIHGSNRKRRCNHPPQQQTYKEVEMKSIPLQKQEQKLLNCYDHHIKMAQNLATMAIGKDHPFVQSL